MDLFLNELSLRHRSYSRIEAIGRMDSILKVLRECRQHGASGVLRTVKGFLSSIISEGYTIRDWLGDGAVEKERRTRFRSAVTKGPYVEEEIAGQEETNAELYEFHFDGDKAFGLGGGFLLESPTVSIPGDVRFHVDPITIKVSTLKAGAQIETLDAEVCSLTNENQATNRAAWIRERVQKDMADGNIAWEKRSEFFPNLTFCNGAATSLRAFSGREPYFYQVCRHLLILNSFCLSLQTSGMAGLTGIRWSDESERTLNDANLRRMREFNDPDGQRRLFSKHTKPTGGNIRIHFLPFPGESKIMIGYIGPHLEY